MKPELLLIPTELERARIRPELLKEWHHRGNRIELCGFGLVASAARTMQLLQETPFASVSLVGIAGSLRDTAAPVGSALQFHSVSCYGIGVGAGLTHRTAGQMGWTMWPSPPTIEDQLPLSVQAPLPTDDPEDPPFGYPLLLSVASASETYEEADWKRKAVPNAVAEDMEGFAVATACRLVQIPVHIFRGISNLAGDRDHQRWKIDESLEEAMQLLLGHQTNQ